MKKRFLAIVALMLALATVFTACGASGDTNMHKLRKAIVDDQTISSYYDGEDIYKDVPSKGPSKVNGKYDSQNYESIEAFSIGGNKNFVQFSATYEKFTENGYYKEFELRITWDAKANTIQLGFNDGYNYYAWDGNKYDDAFQAQGEKLLTLDMNAYYDKGKFEVSDVQNELPADAIRINNKDLAEGLDVSNILIQDAVDVLNKAFNGLNGIYTKKGFPIK